MRAQAAAQALVQQLQELSGESLQVRTVPEHLHSLAHLPVLRSALLLVFHKSTPLWLHTRLADRVMLP